MISSLLKPTIVMNGKKYKVVDQIGEGAFAFVYSVRSLNKDDKNENYAIKKMICQLDEQMSEAKKEIDVMMKIKHVHVLPLLDFSYSVNKKGQSEVCMLLPLYIGSVQSIIDSGPGYPNCSFADGLDVVQILRQCVEGLVAVHASGFRHADLKPANILLTSDYHAVITDFGSAAPLIEVVTTRAEALTVQDKAAAFSTASFRAPELHDTPSNCTIDGKSDVWAIGCCIYSMFYSRTPFETAVEGLSVLAVLSGQYHIPEDNLWPEDYLEIIRGCLTVDPALRLSVEELQLKLKRVTCPPLDLSRDRDVHHSSSSSSGAPISPGGATVSSATEESSAHQSAASTAASAGVQSPLTVTNVRALSAGSAKFADFSQFSDMVVVDASAPSANDAAALSSALAASRDEFGDPVRKQPAVAVSSAVSSITAATLNNSKNESGAAVEESKAGEGVDKHGEHSRILSLSDPDKAGFLHSAVQRGEFTDSSSNNESSYVNSEAFGSQSTFGNNSPMMHPATHGSCGEFVFMEAPCKTASSVSSNTATILAAEHLRGLSLAPSTDELQYRQSNCSSPVLVSEVNTEFQLSEAGKGEIDEFGEDDTFGDFADSWSNNPQVPAAVTASTSSVGGNTLQQPLFVATFVSEKAEEPNKTSNTSNTTKKSTSAALETKEEPEPLDLHKVIIAQSMSNSSQTTGSAGSSGSSSSSLVTVLKEGRVYMMRMGGFPKKLTKKQVWMVLTSSGLVVRKDSKSDSKVHEIVSLHRPLYLTPTDTMAIGLNGVLLRGSSPRDLKGSILDSSVLSHHLHASHNDNSGGGAGAEKEDWVNVTLADLTIDQTKRLSHSPTAASANAKTFRSLFSDLHCEISFDSKDVMNDWLDAIEAQKDICCRGTF